MIGRIILSKENVAGEYRGVGRTLFAAILLAIGGVLNVVWGIAAISNSAFFAHPQHYIFGGLRQTELSASIRMNWTYTPKLSLQLYAQPLISAGRYDFYQELARPRSNSFVRYGRDNGSTIEYVDSTNSYTADPDGAGPAQPLSFGNQNFNFKSLRGNEIGRAHV